MKPKTTGTKTSSSRWQRGLARLLRSTLIVDRVYGLFDRARSWTVLKLAGPAFYEAYNDVAYAATDFVAGRAKARSGLFRWERDAIATHFPPAPCTMLIAGAGGGREAHALAAMGYAIVAFDPARELVASMDAHAAAIPIERLIGRYSDLPRLSAFDDTARSVDLSARPPFDVAILGWGSVSHLRHVDDIVAALRAMSALTSGPMLVSYIPKSDWRWGSTAPHGFFSLQIGYFLGLSEQDMRTAAERAGLSIVALDHTDAAPYAILRRQSEGRVS